MRDFDFESQFRASIRQQYVHEPLRIGSVLVITDLASARAEQVAESAKRFLSGAPATSEATWSLTSHQDLGSLTELLERIDADKPGLLVTYRNIRDDARDSRYALGTWLDTLAQATTVPVLVLPVKLEHDRDGAELKARLRDTDSVMVVTDHLTMDDKLVRYGVEFTQPGGTLHLTHIEEEGTFERYMETISKIPEIDDEVARRTIAQRLLKEPNDFCATVTEALRPQFDVKVESIVRMGSAVQAYGELIGRHKVDLLVADAKDPEKNAMSSLTNALVVEFRNSPFLLL